MIAGFDNPPFDRSPVDGYACKAEDITDASESHPVQLTVLEEIDDSGLHERIWCRTGGSGSHRGSPAGYDSSREWRWREFCWQSPEF